MKSFIGSSHIVSITGSGGKTSLIKLLSHAFKDDGKKVLISTTTKIQAPGCFDFGADAYLGKYGGYEPKEGNITYYAMDYGVKEKRCMPEDLEEFFPSYDVVLLEADGSRSLPLKYHSGRDPVVLPETDVTLMVMGASGFMHGSSEVCFGYPSNAIADFDFFQMLIDSEEGVLKRAKGKKAIIINQCDSYGFESLLKLKAPCPILFSSMQQDKVYETL